MGIPPASYLIGSIGRLCTQKRHDVLIEAFARLRPILPNARLAIVGDGPLAGELRDLVGRLGCQDTVLFVGCVPDPERWLHAMDLFVLASDWEGQPLVIQEAWAAGTPVVASRVAGTAAIIEEGRTGHLFAPGNPTALADAIRGLAANPTEARRLAAAGRVQVEACHGLERMAAAYRRHYLELLAFAGRERA
jgi:glycosyltransferase involved in cell wall biosynthesis